MATTSKCWPDTVSLFLASVWNKTQLRALRAQPYEHPLLKWIRAKQRSFGLHVSRSVAMSLTSYYRMEARRSLLVAGLSNDPKIIQKLQEEAARYQALADKVEDEEKIQSEIK
jgi:hypothetical protein